MSDLTERLDKLRMLLKDNDFLTGKGLSNEVNIRIFCYDPNEELTVQHFVNHQLMTDLSLGCHIIELNLYKLFIEICEDMDILDSIPEMEESEGSVFTLEQIHSAIGDEEFIEKVKEKCVFSDERNDVLILTGVGDVFPFMRVHKILEAMQPHFSDMPILVLYPGTYDGSYLRLFDRLNPSSYYRAFSVI